MKKAGFYIIKEKFFKDMNDPYLKGNKAENRPHYYCFADSADGIFWMIPLSSKVNKYRKIIEKKNREKKPCDIIHIVKLDNGKESVFLIQDMFPVTERYIGRTYTIAGNPLILSSESVVKIIEKKAKKVMKMLKKNIKFTPTQPDINRIMNKLKIKEDAAMLIQGIHHVCIRCNKDQIQEVRNFYESILGLKVVRTWGEPELDGFMLYTGADGILPQGSLRHIALKTEDVDGCAEAVRKAGYKITVEPDDVVIPSEVPMPIRMAFCIGPVGEEIEFFQEK